jgi:ABC-type lipoprotein release transport system permease subunit
MIWLLALRNIIRDKKNSAIILILTGVITFIFFLGNTVIGQSERRLKKTFVENFTGDIVIEKKSDVSMGLFGANVPVIENYFPIEPLPSYDIILESVRGASGIDMITSQISTAAYMNIHSLSYRTGVFLCGVDAATYFPLFPGIVVEEGRLLQSGEYGVMITKERALEIERKAGEKIEIGTIITFTSAGNIGFKIREAPIVGIFSYSSPNSILGGIVITDAQTARILAAIQVASGDVETSQDDTALINVDIEDLFGDNSWFSEEGAEAGDYNLVEALREKLSSGLNAEDDNKGPAQGGEWDFILLRLKPEANIHKTINEINKKIILNGALAVDWRTAAGMTAILVLLLQALYNAGVIIVCIAGIIAIVNILLIAVFRRTREIGTLRAIGAGDNYIRLLLIFENCSLGFAGGIFAVLLGSAVFNMINMLRLNINNELVAGLLGGSILHIDFYPETAVFSIIFSIVLSFISLLFPIEYAVKIEPVIAVREG